MIYLDSRYVDGVLLQPYNAKTGSYNPTVYRTWPTYIVDYYYYEVNEVDRIDNIAVKTLGTPEFWWQIMDINPEILNPFEIPAGTTLRIPSV